MLVIRKMDDKFVGIKDGNNAEQYTSARLSLRQASGSMVQIVDLDGLGLALNAELSNIAVQTTIAGSPATCSNVEALVAALAELPNFSTAGGGTASTTPPDMSNYYGKSETDDAIAAAIATEATARQQNDTTLQSAINGKANISHTHLKSGITDFAHTHLIADLTNFPATMPPATHTHAAADISSGIVGIARGGTGLGAVGTSGQFLMTDGAACVWNDVPGVTEVKNVTFSGSQNRMRKWIYIRKVGRMCFGWMMICQGSSGSVMAPSQGYTYSMPTISGEWLPLDVVYCAGSHAVDSALAPFFDDGGNVPVFQGVINADGTSSITSMGKDTFAWGDNNRVIRIPFTYISAQ